MKPLFQHKTAFITGGSTGIGRATALAFADQGAKVAIADVNEKEAAATVQMIKDRGGKALFIPCDVANEVAVKNAIEKTVDAFGSLDYAFNNAGVGTMGSPIADMTEKDWDFVLDVNLKGPFFCMKYQIQQMLQQETKGSIVNCASILGKVGFMGAGNYVASKHGLIGITEAAALEYAPQGIRVNAVCPGFIKTPMLENAGIMGDKDTLNFITNLHPIKRLGDPGEIAEAVIWLSSDKASFVTGHSLMVDGGYTAQ